jgi:hypothetical protein
VDALCVEFTEPVFQNWERMWRNAVAEGWDTEDERGEALVAAVLVTVSPHFSSRSIFEQFRPVVSG